jgi:hypothetical protein
MDTTFSRRAALVVAGLAFIAWSGAAQAATETIKVPLTGAEQVPPVMTQGKGMADITFDPSSRVVTWDITYSGLSSDVTMAHFHGPAAAGKSGPVALWLSKKGEAVSGPIKGEATLTPEQAKQFEAGEWYVNVHTKDHPAGEIRGQVTPPKM